jgi:hypothetical protein
LAQRRPWWQSFVPSRWQQRTDLRASLPGLKPIERPDPSKPERGVSGTMVMGGSIVGEEYNRELQGKAGIAMYDKMRRSDAQVRATLQVMKLPLLGATWAATPPEDGDEVDQQIADFVNLNIFDDDGMVDSWQSTLRHILMQLDFGHAVFEIKWRVDADGFYLIERMAPRLQKTIHAWHLDRDGKIVRIWQYASVTQAPSAAALAMESMGRSPQPPTTTFEYIPIPGDALAVFVFDKEGDNYEGTSMLRSSYRNFFYKDLIYHLDGVRLDRYGVGIPVAKLEPDHGLSDNDIDDVEQVLKDLRSNERVYLIEPPGLGYRIMTPEGGGGVAAESGGLIDHHDMMISRNVLAGFLTVNKDSTGLGSGASTNALADMFINSLYGIAAGISADLKHVVRKLCDLNFDMTNRQYPTVVVRDLEENDVQGMTGVLLQAVGTLITPDDDLEAMLRKALKLPPLPPELTRKSKEQQAAKAASDAMTMGIRDPSTVGNPPPGAPGAPDKPGGQLPPKPKPGFPAAAAKPKKP